MLRVGRRFTLLWAVILIGGAMLYREQGTPVVVIALAIASFTYGGLLGAFFLALFLRRARQRDAITGMAVSIIIMASIVFAARLVAAFPGLEPILGRFAGIAWPWYVLIGTTITFVVGALVSFLPGGGTTRMVEARERAA
jgi:Na+/proline symporter